MWVAILILAVLVITIWIFIEIKRTRHKLFAWFLIGVIVFGFLSFVWVMKDKEVSYSTISGVLTAGKIYFNWMGSVVGNVGTITTNAIKMDWKANDTKKVEIPKILDKE